MSIELIRATAADASLIFEMQTALTAKTYRPMALATIESAIEYENAFLIFAHKTVAGFLIYKQCTDHILLDEFGVSEEFRGQGLGSTALKLFFDKASGNTIQLFTHPENPALRLYQKHGFQITDSVENFYGDGEPRVKLRRI